MLTEESKLIHEHCAQTDSVIGDATEQNWSNKTSRELGDNLGEEIGTDIIHVVVDFSQKYRALIREDQNDVLNGVEGDGHGNEEKSSISVLNSL
jgi:hypothetical protein